MITGRDIVIVGQQPWDVEIGSNCKNIALEFSKHNRVLYVNPPLDRITMIKHMKDEKVRRRLNVIKKKETGLVEINNNMWNLFPDRLIESINWLKIDWLFDLLNKRNNEIFADSVARGIESLDFKNTIIFNDGDMFRSLYLKEFLGSDFSIYYCRDNFMATEYYKRHGKKVEPLIIAKSDLCLTNSDYLASYCKKYNQNSYNIGQGCDVEIFAEHEANLPDDIAVIQKPIIGYVGSLVSARLDINILIHVALNNPDWSLVLIGPEDDSFIHSKLHQLNNVYFLGSKEVAQLPDYIAAFDICINPQAINELTIGNYPRKIDEYLAMGKPVVATKTLAMKMFEKHTYVAETKEEYSKLIRKALKEDSVQAQQTRRRFASKHTWSNHVKEIYNAILKTLTANNRHSNSRTAVIN